MKFFISFLLVTISLMAQKTCARWHNGVEDIRDENSGMIRQKTLKILILAWVHRRIKIHAGTLCYGIGCLSQRDEVTAAGTKS